MSALLLGNDDTYRLLTDGVTKADVKAAAEFSLDDPAIAFYDFLMGESPWVVEGAGLERTCRWWHPHLPARNSYTKDKGRPWYDRYGQFKSNIRVGRFVAFMSDERFESWWGESISAIGTASLSFFNKTGQMTRHLCPVSDPRNPDIKERVKRCLAKEHLAFGTAGDNAGDGRWTDPEAVMKMVKALANHKAEQEAQAKFFLKTQPEKCMAFTLIAKKNGLKKAAKRCDLEHGVASYIYANPPQPEIPVFAQGGLF